MAENQEIEFVPQEIEPEAPPPAAIALLAKAEIDIAISTAHAYPRNLAKFNDKCRTLAIADAETAASCFYSLPPRGQSKTVIQGPSIRLAEIVLSAWGNIRAGARVIEVADDYVTAQGIVHDLEANVCASEEVRRSIKTREGKRFSSDMIMVTGKAACSIALRNAVFRVVPFARVKAIYEECRKAAIGGAKTADEARANCIKICLDRGVDEVRLAHAVGRPSVKDLTIDDMITIAGLWTAIDQRETTVEDAFPQPSGNGDGGESPTRNAETAAAIAAKAKVAKNRRKSAKADSNPSGQPAAPDAESRDSGANAASPPADPPKPAATEPAKPEKPAATQEKLEPAEPDGDPDPATESITPEQVKKLEQLTLDLDIPSRLYRSELKKKYSRPGHTVEWIANLSYAEAVEELEDLTKQAMNKPKE